MLAIRSRMTDVIVVSSDEEEDPVPKKYKLAPVMQCISKEALQNLNKLKEITATSYNESAKDLSDIICDQFLQKNGKADTSDDKNPIIIDDNEGTVFSAKAGTSSSVVELLDDDVEECIAKDSIVKETTNGDQSSEEFQPLVFQNSEEVKPESPITTDSGLLLEEFLFNVGESVKNTSYELKLLPLFCKLRKLFHKCSPIRRQNVFKERLQQYIAVAKTSPENAVYSFDKIHTYLKDLLQCEAVIVPEAKINLLRKMEKAMKKLLKKIKKLELQDVDFENEDNSSFIKLDAYNQRLIKINKKYCEILHRNPNADRPLYKKISFTSSKYSEINKTITRTCQDDKFPTYREIEICIRKCGIKNNLQLTESDIKEESKSCFRDLGIILKSRRGQDLYVTHVGHLQTIDDPASKDPELEEQLKKNMTKGEENIKIQLDKYAALQEQNVSVELSEDSDDSDFNNSDSDAAD